MVTRFGIKFYLPNIQNTGVWNFPSLIPKLVAYSIYHYGQSELYENALPDRGDNDPNAIGDEGDVLNWLIARGNWAVGRNLVIFVLG